MRVSLNHRVLLQFIMQKQTTNTPGKHNNCGRSSKSRKSIYATEELLRAGHHFKSFACLALFAPHTHKDRLRVTVYR